MCKMAHFGNCDPETADQEYCIFHKPDKSEEEAVEFYRKFLERFKPRVEKIEVEGQKIKRLVFEGPVNARGFVFPKIPSEPIKYKDNKGNSWNQRFSFEYAIFESMCNFSNTSFNGDFSFIQAKFKEMTTFSNSNVELIRFDFSEFRQRVNFRSSKITNISCVNAKFTDAHFSRVLIRNSGIFWETEFKRADFEQSIIHGANFYNARFLEEGNFRHSRIYNGDFGDAVFERAFFENSRIIGHSSFEGGKFRYCSFNDSYLENVDFKGITVDESLNIKRAIINGFVDLRTDLKKLGKNLELGEIYFMDGILTIFEINNDFKHEIFDNDITPRVLSQIAQIQRVCYEHLNEKEKADQAFVLEMRAKRRARIKNARTKLEKLKAHTHNFVEWLLADLPSEYGTNWIRLFLFSLLIIIGNAIPYALWSTYIEGFPQTSNYLVRFANALYYSLVTFTTLGYGDMHPTGWLKALSGIEALTGAVFMALIVAVISRKWMR